jgi:hypothetical protein
LREGRTNEEISDRLGISFYTAKFHVSEILSKLDVSTRDEAVEMVSGRQGRRIGLPCLPLARGLFHVKPARAMMFVLPGVVAVAVLALIVLHSWPRWLKSSADTSTVDTLEVLADFVAGPASHVEQDSSHASEVDGLTLRIIEFFADETRTVVGYEVVGREDEGNAAGPASPPNLIDATGKSYRTIGAVGGSGVRGRQATLVFPAIEPEAGSITLLFNGIVVGKSVTHDGTWRAEHAWDGVRQSTNRQIPLSTPPQAFGGGHYPARWREQCPGGNEDPRTFRRFVP